jgi:hypothetical protein
MTFVTVYRFKLRNPQSEEFIVSLRMATRAAIETMRGEIIDGSAMEVPITEIDAQGFTRRNIPE